MRTYSILAERIPEDRLVIDCQRPPRLYRYSSSRWLERSLRFGEFRLRPASDYKDLSADPARNDDELIRLQSTDGKHEKITLVGTGQDITPVGAVTYRSKIHRDYLVSCFSSVGDRGLFNEFPDTSACLVIHNVEEFCERIHAVAETELPGWVGIDGGVTYDARSPLGAVFSKSIQFLQQQEWRFAWMPPDSVRVLRSVILNIGNIEAIAELRLKN